jgi:excisionase family DNA binding protein
MSHAQASPVREAPAYLTVQEVAALARCEHKAVRRAIAGGHLPAFQPAKKLLIREDDARAWIEGRPAHVAAPAPQPGRRRHRPSGPGSVAKLREIEREASDPRLF